MAAQPAAPPWNWNPGATFVQAFNDAQANQRAQEKMALENELAQILLPQKRAEAEFNLKKLAYDSELLTSRYKLMNEEIDERRRIIRTGGVSGGGGGSSSGGGTSGATTQAQAQDPTSFNLSGTTYGQKSASQPQSGNQTVAPRKTISLEDL